jgi:hypothetical protein
MTDDEGIEEARAEGFELRMIRSGSAQPPEDDWQLLICLLELI